MIQRAYDVLGNESKRKQYDATGRMEKTVDEEFMDTFGGGAFRDKARQQQVDKESMAEQLTVRQSKDFQSHTSGFEAWMRSRGDSVTTFNAENAADQFGVVKTSYEAVPLPKIRCVRSFPSLPPHNPPILTAFSRSLASSERTRRGARPLASPRRASSSFASPFPRPWSGGRSSSASGPRQSTQQIFTMCKPAGRGTQRMP